MIERLNFRKSSYSGHGQNCVEVASLHSVAALRDSKGPGEGHLEFARGEWVAFLASVRRQQYPEF